MPFDSTGWAGHFPLTSKSSAITALPTHVLIDLSVIPGTDDWWGNVQADGDDIRIEDESGNEVEYKLAPGTFSSTSHTGVLEVDIATHTSLSTSTNKAWKVWAGNSGVSAPSYTPFSPTGSALAAHGFSQSPSGSAPQSADFTGNGFNGTASSGIDLTSGQVGNAWELGVDEYVELSGNPLETADYFSVEMLVSATAPGTNNSTLFMIPAQTDWTSPYAVVALRVDQNNKFHAWVNSYFANSVLTEAYTTDVMRHVVLTYNGSDIKIYVDGTEAASVEYFSTLDSVAYNPLVGVNTELFEGFAKVVDELRIYGRALSAGEVATRAANMSAPDGIWTAGSWVAREVTPTFVASEAATASSASEITITKPVGLAEGDLLLALIGWQSSIGGAYINAPSGWTDIGSVTGAGNNNTEAFCKIADAGDVAATNFTFSNGGTSVSYMTGVLSAYRDVDPVYPVDVSLFAEDAGAGDGTVVIAGVTTTNDNCLVVVAAEKNNASPAWSETPPTGFTFRDSAVQSANGDLITFDKLFSTAGATGDVTLNFASSTVTTVTSVVLALNPAGVDPPPIAVPAIAVNTVATSPAVALSAVTLIAPTITPNVVVATPAIGFSRLDVGSIAPSTVVATPLVIAGALSPAALLISPAVAVASPVVSRGVTVIAAAVIAPNSVAIDPLAIAGGLSVPVGQIAPNLTMTTASVTTGAAQVSAPTISATALVITPARTDEIRIAPLSVAATATASAPTVAPGGISVTAGTVESGVNVDTCGLLSVTRLAPLQIAPDAVVTTPGNQRTQSVPGITPATAVSSPALSLGGLSRSIGLIAPDVVASGPQLLAGASLSASAIAPDAVVTAPTVQSAKSLAVATIEAAATTTQPTVTPGGLSRTVSTVAPGTLVTASIQAVKSLAAGVAIAASVAVSAPSVSASTRIEAPRIESAPTVAAPTVGKGAKSTTVPLITAQAVATAPDVTGRLTISAGSAITPGTVATAPTLRASAHAERIWHVPQRQFTWRVRRNRGMAIEILQKQEAEEITFAFDFSDLLSQSGAILSELTSIVAAPDGLTLTEKELSSDSLKAQVHVSGGDAGQMYRLTAVVVTSSGDTLEADGKLYLK